MLREFQLASGVDKFVYLPSKLVVPGSCRWSVSQEAVDVNHLTDYGLGRDLNDEAVPCFGIDQYYS